MKTYKNLFPKIVDEKNLLNAFQNASEGKRFSNGVLDFEKNLAKNILRLRQELLAKQYQHSKYHFFCLFDPKERKISAACFRDQIVHHALCQIIEPIFDKKFIYDSYACRQVKGSHRAVKRLQKFLIEMYQRERERERVYPVEFAERSGATILLGRVKSIASNAIFQNIFRQLIIKF